MRIYIDNVSQFLTNSASLDVSLNVAAGAHYVVVQAWDSGGTVFKTPLNITVGSASPTSACTASTTGVTVCSPAAGATLGSPVQITAAAKSSLGPITAMRIYVDNTSKYAINASSLSTSLTMTAGSHYVVVQAWDSTGAAYKNGRTITVQ
jgi:hypothetical protein